MATIQNWFYNFYYKFWLQQGLRSKAFNYNYISNVHFTTTSLDHILQDTTSEQYLFFCNVELIAVSISYFQLLLFFGWKPL